MGHHRIQTTERGPSAGHAYILVANAQIAQVTAHNVSMVYYSPATTQENAPTYAQPKCTTLNLHYADVYHAQSTAGHVYPLRATTTHK